MKKKSILNSEDAANSVAKNPLATEFKLTSEYFEKNIVLPVGLEQSGHPVTQVKVYRETGIDVIDPLRLKEVIRDTKDIKQVVVEKISVDEATRVSLLFEPKEKNEEFISLLDETGGEKGLPFTDHEVKLFNVEELENLVNEDFLNPNKEKKDNKNQKTTIFNEKVIDKKEIEAIERVVSDVPNDEASEGNELKFKFPNDKNESSENNSKNVSKASFKLKTKIEDKKNLKYEKHTYTRKKAKAGHSYYYRAKDHVELYKVGSSYLKDFKSGLRSFSFSSKGLKEEREKTVLGILSFFNYHQDVNVCVVTGDLEKSFYQKIGKNFSAREESVFDEEMTYQFFSGDGFDVLEFNELKKIERKLLSYNFEDFLDFLLSRYDIILWDLPERQVLDSNKELYFPIIRSLDNVSFIVGKNVSKITEINELVSYFNRYQISIKGLLFSDSVSSKGDKK